MKTKHTPPAEAPALRLIRPTAVYLRPEVCRLLRVQFSTLRREIREGRLRVSRRANRYYFLGKWLIQWIETGEIARNGQSG